MRHPVSSTPLAPKAGRRMPVTALGIDYAAREEILPHRHDVCQLIYAIRGVMVVSTAEGQWILPATRAVWLPAGIEHSIRMVGQVAMRTLYVQPRVAQRLPSHCSVVAVSALLRELIVEATRVGLPYRTRSRDGRLMQLLLDEIAQMQALPLCLPSTRDPRLRIIEDAIRRHPDDQTTAAQWARQLGIDPKTVHRLFQRETGLTFARWRQQARLLRALEMLAQGERIVDIALEVGYSSPTAFSTMFLRQFGCSPSQFFSTGAGGQ